MTSLVIRFLPSDVELSCDGETTILEVALAAGFIPNHSCRRGECGACKTRIVSGSVRYLSGRPEALTEGHCLSCMAIPTTNVILDSPEVLKVTGRRTVKVGTRVTSVERLGSDVAVVRIQAPADSGFCFRPGQYVDVLMRDGNRRSYSMANNPEESGVIELHIRAIPGGRFSQHVYRNLKLRDMLKIEGPFGTFTLRESDAPLIFVASGTGYAPIASMMRTHAEDIARRGAAFYWGARRQEDLYAFEEAVEWARSCDRLRFIPVLSDPSLDWQGRTGFVQDAVQDDYSDLSAFEVYACGNPLMIVAARRAFCLQCGLKEANFLSDSFVAAPCNTGMVSTPLF
ncbi:MULTISPECIES: FAD-binding oxidoreductase [unclassified Burkholderia]|uniref:FAD-binding oxidoreductase n=1 Tax=unclassified Burkholderia TaxID=2613784 RepID=UPI001629CB0F|nr:MULTISPECIES: FAD-binding oxidoreductase [unclassified Burkholderia]